MKKFLTILIVFFTFATLSFAQKSSFTVQTGYSLSTGLIGAEYQFGKVSITAGWMPLRMPESHKFISSFSAAITAYGCDWNESGWYASGAFASTAYRSEKDVNGVWVEDIVSPMTILHLGYKQYLGSGLSLKGGVGYGWCKYIAYPTLEISARWTFGI